MLNNENNLWIGTNGGLVRLNKQSGGKQFFNRSNGLPSTAVSALAMNDEGELWLSSEDCIISKYNGTGFDILEATESQQSNCNNYALAIDEHTEYGTAHYAYTQKTKKQEEEQSLVGKYPILQLLLSLWSTHTYSQILETKNFYISEGISLEGTFC